MVMKNKMFLLVLFAILLLLLVYDMKNYIPE